MPKIDPEVKEVLEKAEVTESTVSLAPCGKLPRLLYLKVNKVLECAGGKWDRKAGVHLFEVDPRHKLGLALESGEIDDRKKTLQQFFTPPELAAEIAELACIQDGDTVLEPSCGDGSLAAAAAQFNPSRFILLDVDNAMLAKAKRRVTDLCPSAQIVADCGDFLSQSPTTDMLADRIVMNPPFTNHQDVHHVTHALRFLKPGGRLVAIMSPSWRFNAYSGAERFRCMLMDLDHDVDENPPGSFKQSGTMVETVTLIVRYPEVAPKVRRSLRDRYLRSRA